MVTEERARSLNDRPLSAGPVVYWMSRDQRAADNWALLHAQRQAILLKAPLAVVFCLAPKFLGATMRHYGFMLRGLEETSGNLRRRGIPFFLVAGDPAREIPAFASERKAALVITDFDPLRIKLRWKARAGSALRVPLVEVDAHNIVPCWTASGKGEYAAYTFRPRILGRLERFLVPFPRLKGHPFPWPGKVPGVDWGGVLRGLKIDRGVGEVRWIRPGERAARRALKRFLQSGLDLYAEKRNDPSGGGQSDLSPYLHFGQLSAQRVALEVRNSGGDPDSVSAFLEELIVRRELADNFCFYNQAYDSVEAFPDWARKTLHEARRDPRPYLYRFADLEGARTHDPLWNAAQRQMLVDGKMHGYMRMYWAKKILEWTPSPEEALETAIALNDRYELDGRDPNGYAGVAWSIGGVHDRAWGRRPVFGKIRYMSDRGIRSKFDVGSYLEAWGPSPGREE